MAKLGLSMIVKNETHVLPRLLNSVSPVIDYWVIVDTGSTDGTQDLIRKFFDEKGIPGQLIQADWKDDFSYARNISLEEIEKHVDYGMWIDADEEFCREPGFTKEAMLASGFDSISLRTVYGKVDYTRKNIWKTGKNFKWNGPIHELLGSTEEVTGTVAPKVHVVVRPEGSSWSNIREKYLSHAKILENFVSTTNDPRWVFYTAQSYRDAGEYPTSIEWYKKRAAMNTGFPEEVFVSKFMVAKLSEGIGKSKVECTNLYQDAHAADPFRGESIKGLIQMYQRLQDWENAYVFSLYGIRYNRNNPYPNRILFLDKMLYDYEMLELHSLSCFYTKRNEEGSRCYWLMRRQLQELGEDQYLSPEAWGKVLENAQYFPKPSVMPTIPKQAQGVAQKRGSNYTPPKRKKKR